MGEEATCLASKLPGRYGFVAQPLANDELVRALETVPGVGESLEETEERARRLAGRPTRLSRQRLDFVVSAMDLTSLNSTDTPEHVQALAHRAKQPDTTGEKCPAVAAVCVYPDLVRHVVRELAGSGVRSACVAGAFPHGRASRTVKLHEMREALDAGADEIDMVLDRAAFLAGDYVTAYDDIAAARRLCETYSEHVRLKVIVETGELLGGETEQSGYDVVRRAAWLAMLGGAHFVKTSTGKSTPAATLPAVLAIIESCRDFHALTSIYVGVKAAGGIRTADQALEYVSLVQQVAPQWLRPDRFRLGASSLLDDVVARRRQGVSN